MENGAFVTMTAAFGLGILSAIAWPSRAGARWVSLVAAIAGCVAAVVLAGRVLGTGEPWVFRQPALFQLLGGFSLTLDRLGALFLALIGLTGIPASIYGLGYLRDLDGQPRGRVVLALFSVFLAGLCLVPCADNVLTFLFGWELMAVASYLLVVSDPADDTAAAAGLWYAAMTHAGFAALLVAFLMLAQNGPLDFAAMRAHAAALSPSDQIWVFALGLVAFGSKAGLVPLHVWLPRAHPAAPSHVSALMSAVMVKLGVYGCIRLFFDLLPPGPAWWGGVVLLAGLVTAVTGVLYSVTESHFKRLLAYSTIENVGIIFVGLGFALLMRGYGYTELAALGLAVSLLHTLNHACFKTLLFLGAGAVVHAVHSASLEAHGGLIKRMPQTAALCLVGVMSLAALPPFNGFPSEWLTFQFLVAGARHTAPELAILLPLALALVALTAGLAAVSAVRLFGISFLALPRSAAAAGAREAPASMRLAMTLPALACVALGVFPTMPVALLTDLVGDLDLPINRVDAGASLTVPMIGSQLWPAMLAAALLGGALLIAAVVRLRAPATSTGPAWNCGRLAQSARSEYTAAAFAEPLRRVFTGFYQPTQEVTVETHPVSRYFVRSMAYRGALAPWLEQALYTPIVRAVQWVSLQTRRLQDGSIHTYLAYLAGALLVMLLISQWVGR